MMATHPSEASAPRPTTVPARSTNRCARRGPIAASAKEAPKATVDTMYMMDILVPSVSVSDSQAVPL